MSIIYGNETNHWRSYIDTSTSEDGKTLTASVTVGIQTIKWAFRINTGIRGTANVDGQTNSANTSFNTSNGSWTTKDIVSTSKKFSKKYSAYDITLSGTVTNSSGYMNGTSSASQIISVPALARHYVSFDANGGENAPAKADKWYGEQVTIPTSTPTRSNYQFLGWSTSKTGSVQYLPGNKYWVDDKDITLYAIWKLSYNEPKFTEGLCIRTTDSTSTTENPSGEYIYGSFSWHVDTSIYADNVPSKIVVTSSKDGLDAVNIPFTGTTSLPEGTINFHFSAALDSNYVITCTIVDNQNGTAKLTRSVSNGSIPIDVSNKGRSIGIMSTAPSVPGVKIGSIGTGAFSISSTAHDKNFSSNASVSGETNNSNQGVLTLDTSGSNSSGESSKGTIKLIADNLTLNGCPLTSKAWVMYEAPSGTWTTSDGLWNTDSGLFRNVIGPSNNNMFTTTGNKLTLSRGIWKLFYAKMGYPSRRIMSGFFDAEGHELCSSSAYTNNVHSTAICEYVCFVDSSMVIIPKFQTDPKNGTVYIGRPQSYLNLTYVGPL